MRKFSFAILSVFFLLTLTGCPSTGIYRTAHILEEDEGDFGMSFNFTRINTRQYVYDNQADPNDPNANVPKEEDVVVTFPNLLPELSYHIGTSENTEVGGRIAIGSGLMELDFKYRFFKSDSNRLHMAVQPALGYQSLFLLEGLSATLPLILTYDLTNRLSLNLYGFGNYSNLKPTDKDLTSDGDLSIDGLRYGGGVGLRIKSGKFYFMPTIDISNVSTSAEVSSNGQNYTSDDYNRIYTVVGLTFGWAGDGNKKQLDRIEKKIDKINAD